MNKFFLLPAGLLLLFFTFQAVIVYAQPINDGHFTLSGKVTGRDTGKLILQYLNKNKKYIMDTVWLKSGDFSFSGYLTVNGPTYARLVGDIKTLSVNDPNMGDIFLEPGVMTAKLTENDFAHPLVSGSVTQRSYDTVNNKIQIIYGELKPLDQEYTRLKRSYGAGNKSKELMDSLKATQLKTVSYLERRDKVYYTYIWNHPDSYLSAGIMARFILIRKMGLDSVEKYFNNLTPRIRSSALGMEAFNNLQNERQLKQAAQKGGTGAVGSIAQSFTIKDINNKPLSLSGFKNKKYVLLDFWATWCGPCKELIPRIKGFYNQYHAKDLEVISISLDFNQKDWRDGVQKEGLNQWYNVYTGENKDSELTLKYGVQVIPTAILIDKNGQIIGRYTGLGGDDGAEGLEKQLNGIFK